MLQHYAVSVHELVIGEFVSGEGPIANCLFYSTFPLLIQVEMPRKVRRSPRTQCLYSLGIQFAGMKLRVAYPSHQVGNHGLPQVGIRRVLVHADP